VKHRAHARCLGENADEQAAKEDVRKPTSSKMQDFMPKIGRGFVHVLAVKGVISMQK
jgi:hypothetical protein